MVKLERTRNKQLIHFRERALNPFKFPPTPNFDSITNCLVIGFVIHLRQLINCNNNSI